MATGHLNPGYGNIVTALGRLRPLYQHPVTEPGLVGNQRTANLDAMTFDEIRTNARDIWSRHGTKETSYQNHYPDKLGQLDEPTRSRPTSTERRNKPHPPLVFLTTRMHNVPGFFNPDASLGKDVYRVDASLPPAGQQERATFRSKYTTKTSTAAVRQYSKPEEIDKLGQAWAKHASPVIVDDDRYQVYHSPHTKSAYSGAEERNASARSYCSDMAQPIGTASIHRYLKQAGQLEKEKLAHYNRGTGHDYGAQVGTIGSRRRQDLDGMRRTTYTHKPKRGDFLIHPEWPPVIKHHRLNGLSSVDIPYVADNC